MNKVHWFTLSGCYLQLKKMKLIIIILITILSSCNFSPKGNNEIEDEKKIDTLETADIKKEENDLTDNQRYLKSREIILPYKFTNEVSRINDTKINLPFDIKDKYGIVGPSFALLDFNKDGYDDLFFEYYGLSGTGEKNVIDIYFFEPTENKFSDSCITLMNPSYFFDKNIITSYYYGLGGGSATKYLLTDGKLNPIESIEIYIESSKEFKATFSYSQKPFSDTLKCEDNMVRLPEEYEYRKIIKEANNG